MFFGFSVYRLIIIELIIIAAVCQQALAPCYAHTYIGSVLPVVELIQVSTDC